MERKPDFGRQLIPITDHRLHGLSAVCLNTCAMQRIQLEQRRPTQCAFMHAAHQRASNRLCVQVTLYARAEYKFTVCIRRRDPLNAWAPSEGRRYHHGCRSACPNHGVVHPKDVRAPVKYDSEKLRYDLLSTPAMDSFVSVLTYGAKKYADFNWLNNGGLQYTRVIGALLRHTFAILRGEDLDVESNLPHAAHAMCCCMFLLHFTLTKTGIDNRYKSL